MTYYRGVFAWFAAAPRRGAANAERHPYKLESRNMSQSPADLEPTRTSSGRLREYLNFLRWFARELRPWWPRFGWSAACSLGGALGHLAGFVVVFKYVAALQSDRQLAIGSLVIGHVTSAPVFAGATLLVLALMLFAAVLEFQGRALAARISHDYRLHTEQSLWVRLSAHNANPAARRPPLPDSRVLALMREVRAAETAARLLALGLSNLLILPVGLTAMCVIDWQLTLIVLALALASSAAFYRISLQVSQQRQTEQQLLQSVQEERRGLLERCAGAFAPLLPDDPELERLYRTGATGKTANALLAQFLTTQRGGLIGQCVVAVATAAIFLAGGLHAVSAGHGWTQLLLYLVVLRLVGGKLAASARTLIALNRHYAGLRRYVLQVHALEDRAPEQGQPADSSGLSLSLADGSLAVCQAGEVVAVLGPSRMTTSLLGQLVAATSSSGRLAVGGIAQAKPAPKMWYANWGRVLSLPRKAWREAATSRLNALGLDDMARSLTALPESPRKGFVASDEHRALSLMLNLFRLLDSGVRHIVLEFDDLRTQPEATRVALLAVARQATGVVFVRITLPRFAALCCATRVLASDGERLLPENAADAGPESVRPLPAEEDVLRELEQAQTFDVLDE